MVLDNYFYIYSHSPMYVYMSMKGIHLYTCTYSKENTLSSNYMGIIPHLYILSIHCLRTGKFEEVYSLEDVLLFGSRLFMAKTCCIYIFKYITTL